MGGIHGGVFAIHGLFGAGIVFGVAWLVTWILPFVDTLRLGSTTGWVLGAVGYYGGCVICAITLDGWRETRRSLVQWAIIMVVLFGPLSLVGFYFEANPDSGLLKTITELGERAPKNTWKFMVLLPVLVGIILCAVGLLKYYISGEHRRQREAYRWCPRNRP